MVAVSTPGDGLDTTHHYTRLRPGELCNDDDDDDDDDDDVWVMGRVSSLGKILSQHPQTSSLRNLSYLDRPGAISGDIFQLHENKK